MPRAWLPFLLSSLLLPMPWLHAQADAEVVRRPTFARVETNAGEPLAGAVVTFAGGLPHLGVDAGPRDVLQVQTDARGRAQAKLLPGLCYVVWAVGPADERGERAATAPYGWFGAGALVSLRANEPIPALRVAVRGAEAWSSQGPLRYFAMTSMPGAEIEIVPTADGELVMPLDPIVAIEVRTARDEKLWFQAPAADVVIPPPTKVVVRARDEAGAPLPGALVRQRVGRLAPWRVDSLTGVNEDRWRELGRTDAEGRCVVEVPYAGNPLKEANSTDVLLFVGAPGRPSVAGGAYRRGLLVDDRKVPSIEGDELPFTCRPVPPLAGSVGRVPAGSIVHLAAVCKVYFERNSYQHDPRSFHATVGADGAFAFDDVPAEVHSCRFSLVRGDGLMIDLPTFPALRGRELPSDLAVGSPGLSPESFADVTVQVVETGGGPARGVVAVLAPAERPGVLLRDSAQRIALDARGASKLRLQPGKWIVMAFTESGWAASAYEFVAGANEVALAMQPTARMRIEARDAEGKPIAGAHVEMRGTSMRGTNDPVQSMLQGLRSQWTTQWSQLRTDAQGRLVIPFVPVEGVLQKLGLRWRGGGSAEFVLEASEDWAVVGPR